MKRCKICGCDLGKDLFASVAGKPTCTICTQKFVGGNFSDERIAAGQPLGGDRQGHAVLPENLALGIALGDRAAAILGKQKPVRPEQLT